MLRKYRSWDKFFYANWVHLARKVPIRIINARNNATEYSIIVLSKISFSQSDLVYKRYIAAAVEAIIVNVVKIPAKKSTVRYSGLIVC